MTQILIARRFFAERKKLPAPVAWAMTAVLSVLWVAFVFALPFRFPRLVPRLAWVPHPIRGVLIATGNIWGMTAVASFGIYLLFRVVASRGEPTHSPERRRLIQAA